MAAKQDEQTGLTRDVGWQVGLRRTVAVPAPVIWDFLLSVPGQEIWLGRGAELKFQPGENYHLNDGTRGEVKVYRENSHFRITRLPPDPAYQRPATIQIRIVDKEDRAVVAFHEEHLPGKMERERRKAFYLSVIERLKKILRA